MQVIIVTMGSRGDINPFIEIGKNLLSKGIIVTALSNAKFERDFTDAKMNFVSCENVKEMYPFAQEERKRSYHGNQEIEHQLQVINDLYIASAYSICKYVEVHFNARQTVIINHFLAFGARLASEITHIPNITIMLSPHWISNGYDMIFSQGINKIRKKLALEKVTHIMTEWMLEGKVIALYPEWFKTGQKVAIEDICYTDFIYRTAVEEERKIGQQRYIVFRVSSAQLSASLKGVSHFFNVAQNVCQDMKKQAIFITNGNELSLKKHSEYIKQYDYVALEAVFREAYLLVHDGGIGTCAEALRAGIAQIICPRLMEQQTNAIALKEQGYGEILKWENFNEQDLKEKISDVLSSDMPNRCREYRGRQNNNEVVISKIYEETIKLRGETYDKV